VGLFCKSVVSQLWTSLSSTIIFVLFSSVTKLHITFRLRHTPCKLLVLQISNNMQAAKKPWKHPEFYLGTDAGGWWNHDSLRLCSWSILSWSCRDIHCVIKRFWLFINIITSRINHWYLFRNDSAVNCWLFLSDVASQDCRAVAYLQQLFHRRKLVRPF